MDFCEVTSRAKQWLSDNSRGLLFSGIKEEERNINFKTPHCSFYITVPQGHEEEWGVWSSEDDCLSIISQDLEHLLQPSNTIEQILDRVCVLLETAEKGAASNKGEEEEEEEEEEEGLDDYYGDDMDVYDDDPTEKKSNSDDKEVSANDFFIGQGSPAAVHRLLADLKSLKKSSSKYGIAGQPINDNLFVWEVELSDFPEYLPLAKDLERYASRTKRKPVIAMEMKFPKDYPMNPPFVRILRPRFKFLTGHVTVGGSICMQMLTRSGWSPSNDIESILVQIRAEIMSDPNARLEAGGGNSDYSEQEAKAAFERMIMKYGWNR